MGNSLQDQLLKLGLVNEKKARQTRQEKRQQEKKGLSPEAEKRLQIQKVQAEKAERDRQLNLQRKEAAERKETAAQIKQMIEANRLPKNDGETAYNFIDGRKVRRLYVNPDVHRQLVAGSAVVVKLHGQYNIVPLAVAEKIRERDASCIVAGATETASPETVDPNDPYANYQVPDDLMW